MPNTNQLAQPQKVNTAVKLLYASLGVGIIRGGLESPRLVEISSVGSVLFDILFVLGSMWLLIYMTGKGKNWARITFLVFFILGIPLFILPMYLSLTYNPISGILGLVQLVMQVVALVFLFQGESSAWFKAIKQSKTENAQQSLQTD